MPTIEVQVGTETERELMREADLLDFDGVSEYLEWLVARRQALARDNERGRRLRTFLDEAAEDVEVSDGTDSADSGDSSSQESEPTIGGSVERTVRVRDETLATDADSLSTVETDRLDEFARRAVEQTRSRLGDGVGTGLEYDASNELSSDDERRPGSDLVDLDDIEVPGYDDELVERRRIALGAAVAFLREREEATRSDFVDHLYEDIPAGYESEGSWWECIKTGLRQVDRVDPAGSSSRVWRYRTTAGRVTRLSF